MVLKKEFTLKKVIDGLSLLRVACEARAKLGLTDLQVVAEAFFCPLLNEVFELKLRTLKTGHPAIDLGDPIAGVGFQITTDNRKQKIQDTLDVYARKGLFATYPSLKVLIIGNRRSTYTLRIPKSVAFDAYKDVLDLHTLGDHIKHMGASQLRGLAKFIDAEIANEELGIRSAPASRAVSISLNGKPLNRPETDCQFAPYAGWRTEMVIHNTSGNVIESGDVSIAFVVPPQLRIISDWDERFPVYKYPVRLSKSEVLYELTNFSRILPGARETYGVPIRLSEDALIEVGKRIAIKVQVHTRDGQLDYPVKLTIVNDDDLLCTSPKRRKVKRLRRSKGR